MSLICNKLHKLVNCAKRFNFPFDEKDIPDNGIYILFEKGEKAHSGDRIVRIGTHTGANQLRSRLEQHFINENKDRSIFRKNIGRALLNKSKDPYLRLWEIDLTTRKNKERFSNLVDIKKQRDIENQVTKYIQDNFSFAALKMDDKEKRLDFESKLISTVSLCEDCKPSSQWLGLSSPKQKIKKSGLWLVNELYKKPLSEQDFELLDKAILNKSKGNGRT